LLREERELRGVELGVGRAKSGREFAGENEERERDA